MVSATMYPISILGRMVAIWLELVNEEQEAVSESLMKLGALLRRSEAL